jgi:hypothetical protein
VVVVTLLEKLRALASWMVTGMHDDALKTDSWGSGCRLRSMAWLRKRAA